MTCTCPQLEETARDHKAGCHSMLFSQEMLLDVSELATRLWMVCVAIQHRLLCDPLHLYIIE